MWANWDRDWVDPSGTGGHQILSSHTGSDAPHSTSQISIHTDSIDLSRSTRDLRVAREVQYVKFFKTHLSQLVFYHPAGYSGNCVCNCAGQLRSVWGCYWLTFEVSPSLFCHMVNWPENCFKDITKLQFPTSLTQETVKPLGRASWTYSFEKEANVDVQLMQMCRLEGTTPG